MKFKKLTVIFVSIISVSILSIVGIEWWNTNKTIVSTDNAYVRSSITTISARVSSYVTEVPAVTHSYVKKDQLLAVLDSEPFENNVNALKASLEASKAKIDTINSSFENIDANVNLVNSEVNIYNSKAKALSSELELANQNLSRMERLYEKKSISKAKLDEAITRVKSTSHNLDSAIAKTNSIKNKLDVLSTEKSKIISLKNELIAGLKKSQAQLDAAIVDLNSTKIYSPINGVVANRIAEPGIYVEDGWPLMAIVPTHDIWIMANYKETQVENIKVGQKVKLAFDAFEDAPIIGQVHSISPASSASFSLLPPQNASGNFVKVVQRVPVKITFDIPEKLFGRIVPGLSVVVSIDTKSDPSVNLSDKNF